MRINSSRVCGSLIALLSLSSLLAAEVPAYKVEKSFGQKEIKAPPASVCMDAKDRLHVLLRNGTVLIYDAEGKPGGSFKAEMTPAPTAMTVADGNIYLFASERKETTREFQGKKVKMLEPAGVKCCVYDAAGTKGSEARGSRSPLLHERQ